MSLLPPDATPSVAARRLVAALGACAVGCAATAPIGKAPFNLFFWAGALLWLGWAATVRGGLAAALRTPVVAGGAVLCALYAASVAWSAGPRDLVLAQIGSYRVLLMPLMFLPALALPAWRERTLAGLLAALGLVLALSFAQWIHPLPFAKATLDPMGLATRDAYVFTDRIRQSVHLSVLLLWAAGTWLLVRGAPPRLRLACGAIALLCVVDMLWLLKGRTGYAIVGGLTLFLLHARYGARGTLAGALAIAAVAAALWAGMPLFSERLAGSGAEIRAYLDTGANNATGERLEMWSNSLRMIASAPVLGNGIESYRTLSEAMYAAKGRVPLEVYHDPHQEFLYVAVELGLVGLALLVAGLAGIWRAAAGFDDRWRWLARGMVVAYVAAGLFNCLLNVGWTGYFFGILLAMVAGRQAQARGAAGCADPVTPARSPDSRAAAERA